MSQNSTSVSCCKHWSSIAVACTETLSWRMAHRSKMACMKKWGVLGWFRSHSPCFRMSRSTVTKSYTAYSMRWHSCLSIYDGQYKTQLHFSSLYAIFTHVAAMRKGCFIFLRHFLNPCDILLPCAGGDTCVVSDMLPTYCSRMAMDLCRVSDVIRHDKMFRISTESQTSHTFGCYRVLQHHFQFPFDA